MRRLLALLALTALAAPAQEPFTLRQILSAPYALSLTASPVGARFAWVENAEGRRNIWVGGPGEAARQLTHYGEDDGQDLSGLTWSPDGSAIVFSRGTESGASGKPANPAHLQRATPVELYLQPMAGNDAVKLGEGHGAIFARDGKSIFFVRAGQICMTRIPSAKSSGEAAPQQQLLDGLLSVVSSMASAQAAPQVVFDSGSASGLTLSPDGKKLAYISHRRTHSLLALFDLRTRTLTFPASSTGRDFAPIFSRDGKQLVWLRYPFTDAPEFAANRISPNPWSIQILDVASGVAHTLFSPEANKPGNVEPRMSTGEPHLYFSAANRVLFFSEADGWVHLYSIDAAGLKSAVLLTPGKFEVEDATLADDGRTVVYSSNEVADDPLDVDRRHVWRVDLTSSKPKPVLLTHSRDIETHPLLAADGITLAALASSASLPSHPVLVGPSGRLSDLHPHAFPEEYPEHKLVTPQQVLFPSADKLLELHGQLFLPRAVGKDAPRRRPAILFFHGGPKRQMLLGYPSMDYYSDAYAMNQYLRSRGYIVLSVNYRCGIGYGLDFRQCEHSGADGAAEYNDALGAAAYLRSRPDVDQAHIGVWGGSYGGYFTALALARNSDIFAAGVDFHGVHEWAREDNAAADWLRGSLADQERIAAVAHTSSPMADVAKWRSPVLLIHGDDDPEVAYSQTPVLADALRAGGVHVEELVFPDEVHDFLLHKDWLAAYEAEANFFDRMLKP